MNCWHCKSDLVWGGDHDMEDESDDFAMVTNLSCMNENCGSFVQVFLPVESDDE